MKATIVDLRYRMNDVLKALERNESVHVLCRGRVKGILHPAGDSGARARITDHPFFGSRKDAAPVRAAMDRLRGRRYRDL